MGRVRNFAFDAVIGIGGVSRMPRQLGIAGKINWVGRNPRKSANPIDSRGPLVTFAPKDFRLFEHQGPLLSEIAPLLAKKVFNSSARFYFLSVGPKEMKEAQQLLGLILDLGKFDHVQIATPLSAGCSKPCQKLPKTRNHSRRKKVRCLPNSSKDCIRGSASLRK